MIVSASLQSARGLAHSKTLRASRQPLIFAPASWSAAALRRFPIRAIRVILFSKSVSIGVNPWLNSFA